MGCPSGWHQRDESCYYFYETATKVWNDSRSICQTIGSDLAVISSEDENQFIANRIEDYLILPTRAVWIGLQRDTITSTFHWIDGTPLEGGYENWKSGEPNNVKGNEDCVFMVRGGRWNDDPCNLNGYSFWDTRDVLTLCEMPA